MSEQADFWSRRKARVAAETQTEERARIEAERETEVAALEDRPDAEILQELGLPDPDTMEAGDDFSVFMKTALPERIRRRALRKLWLTNPVLANVDGLVDYGEDFTDSAMVVENMQTAYQVGKGMLKHVQEMARQEAIRNGTAEVDETASDLPEDLAATEDVPVSDTSEPTPSVRPPSADPAPEHTTFVADEAEPVPANVAENDPDPDVTSFDTALPVRRRLRFDFET